MRAHLLAIAILAATGTLRAADAIRNGDFEHGLDGWTVWGASPSGIAHGGKGSCRVHLDTATWAGASQIVSIPSGRTGLRVEGWLRSDSIRGGSGNWERGRLSVEFLDAKGDTTGGYPPAAGQVRGRMSWTRVERTYPLPANASSVKVGCVLGNTPGTLHCDDIRLTFLP